MLILSGKFLELAVLQVLYGTPFRKGHFLSFLDRQKLFIKLNKLFETSTAGTGHTCSDGSADGTSGQLTSWMKVIPQRLHELVHSEAGDQGTLFFVSSTLSRVPSLTVGETLAAPPRPKHGCQPSFSRERVRGKSEGYPSDSERFRHHPVG